MGNKEINMEPTEFLCSDKEVQHICEIIKNKLYFMSLMLDKNLKNSSDNIYFCIDKELLYHNYYCDFGPLNLSCLYKYCTQLNMYFRKFPTKRIIHYTTADPNKRSNAAYLMGSYCIIYLNLLPRDAFKLLSSNRSPAYRNFLDASIDGSSGYTIRLIDVLSAVYKARLFGFFNFNDFDVHGYDFYNLLKNGDLNWLLPRKFLAFIGPIDNPSIPGMFHGINCHPASFYVNYFLNNDVRTVVRLNNKLYEESVFVNAGISHFDMYFIDGSSPPKEILLKFLDIAENSRGAIAVHCKAGLGRTGSLIGAYIVKHYRMTAREAIGWLRICRPGSVIGQQQGWLEKIEKWLWREGNQYRLEYFGEGDRIPHHRYGVNSLKWQEVRIMQVKQTKLKQEASCKNLKKKKFDFCRSSHTRKSWPIPTVIPSFARAFHLKHKLLMGENTEKPGACTSRNPNIYEELSKLDLEDINVAENKTNCDDTDLTILYQSQKVMKDSTSRKGATKSSDSKRLLVKDIDSLRKRKLHEMFLTRPRANSADYARNQDINKRAEIRKPKSKNQSNFFPKKLNTNHQNVPTLKKLQEAERIKQSKLKDVQEKANRTQGDRLNDLKAAHARQESLLPKSEVITTTHRYS